MKFVYLNCGLKRMSMIFAVFSASSIEKGLKLSITAVQIHEFHVLTSYVYI